MSAHPFGHLSGAAREVGRTIFVGVCFKQRSAPRTASSRSGLNALRLGTVHLRALRSIFEAKRVCPGSWQSSAAGKRCWTNRSFGRGTGPLYLSAEIMAEASATSARLDRNVGGHAVGLAGQARHLIQLAETGVATTLLAIANDLEAVATQPFDAVEVFGSRGVEVSSGSRREARLDDAQARNRWRRYRP